MQTCVGVTRQLHYSTRNNNSLDIVLSVNGIPVATLELKNHLTGQTVQDAIRQYQIDRDPREVIFEFKRRTLVHFAADPDLVFMTTRLAGSATHFLPFNRGCEAVAGNPSDETGRHRTAYLWEEVLNRDSLLDLLARFLHLQIEERRTDDGRKVKKEVADLSELPPVTGSPRLGRYGEERRRRKQLPDRAFGGERQEQHDRLASAPIGFLAQRCERASFR